MGPSRISTWRWAACTSLAAMLGTGCVKANENFDEPPLVETESEATGSAAASESESASSDTMPDPSSSTTTTTETTDPTSDTTPAGECQDEYEPNNGQEAATNTEIALGPEQQETIGMARLHQEDRDWFRYAGITDVGGAPKARVELLESEAVMPVCIFLTCRDGEPELECDDMSEPAESLLGTPGCCGLRNAIINGYTCSGDLQDVDIFVELEPPEAEACLTYDLVVSL